METITEGIAMINCMIALLGITERNMADTQDKAEQAALLRQKANLLREIARTAATITGTALNAEDKTRETISKK